ncbi:hypothetical protein BGW36DRAFT_407086 [Talaromyces proteolyticus]|uniref:Uncharacterized protein n=1 Tax=Talaromyces proteolyticus TaxID=1131652 RepID=A0AAD4KZC3_9EURO|nr:uncharacterized protein BGW36DRAFT_407086 [Talaromyces proteolyticus]KAH8699291.1 hypothetical protein BGW36DRAFT_407086 [Talaromyces proteolyticus]
MKLSPSIPQFLLPRGISSHTLRYAAATRGFSSSFRWQRSRTGGKEKEASDKPRTLAQPDKFRPPSHPARRVLPTRNGKPVIVKEPFNYPGPPQSAVEKEAQKTKRYPNMFPPEGTVMHKFLTTRWIHAWIAMGVLTTLATFTFTENFKRTSPFAHLLPPWSGFLSHPINTVSQAVSVWKMHVEHNSVVARENRHKRIDDAEKRRQYRIAHGLEEPAHAGASVVEDDQSPIAAGAADTMIPMQQIQTEASGDSQQFREGQKRPVKKWLGIW